MPWILCLRQKQVRILFGKPLPRGDTYLNRNGLNKGVRPNKMLELIGQVVI